SQRGDDQRDAGRPGAVDDSTAVRTDGRMGRWADGRGASQWPSAHPPIRPSDVLRSRHLVLELDQHLGITLRSLIELLVRLRRLVDRDSMAHDPAWLCAAANDQVAQVFVVAFHRALTEPN